MKWWLSFADEHRCLGVAIVEASDLIGAVRAAHMAGCNPGGEVRGVALDSDEALAELGHLPTYRLLDPASLDDVARRRTPDEVSAGANRWLDEHYGAPIDESDNPTKAIK